MGNGIGGICSARTQSLAWHGLKDLALSQLQCRLKLWLRSDLWFGNSICCSGPKKGKKETKTGSQVAKLGLKHRLCDLRLGALRGLLPLKLPALGKQICQPRPPAFCVLWKVRTSCFISLVALGIRSSRARDQIPATAAT